MGTVCRRANTVLLTFTRFAPVILPLHFTIHAWCSYGDNDIDISGLEQIVHRPQTEAVLLALHKIARAPANSTIRQIVDEIDNQLDQKGLEATLSPNSLVGNLSRPRKYEIAGTLSRLRLNGVLQ